MKITQPKDYAEKWRSFKNTGGIKSFRIERRTNRHRETGGGYWGWYEVFPFGDTLGYWGTGRDDLTAAEIEEWNKTALEISATGVAP